MNVRDAGFYVAGLAFLALAKGKHLLQGYTSPKPFDIANTERCIAYDSQVVEQWLKHLERYTGKDGLLAGKNVLELGPGSDLGVGVLLLAGGAKQYNACDVHDLARHTPRAFYDALFNQLSKRLDATALASLRTQLDAMEAGTASRLNYVVRHEFELASAVGIGTVDLVFSQAAFEHFDDIDDVVAQLTTVCAPGAIVVAEIDLKTHSRWIRDTDPNNIYRYPERIYNAFHFRGIPNRRRPYEYRAAFERHGWTKISVTPLTSVGPNQSSASGMHSRFTSDVNEMEYLTVVISATKRS